jgi:hypothetical protein
MAFYSADWKYRVALTIDNSTAAGATIDAEGTIPKSLDFFWGEIDTAGNELRITDAAGNLLAYDIIATGGGAFSKTNKDGKIQIDGMTVPAATNSMVLAWMYYGSTSTQGDASVAVVIAAARTLSIEHGVPVTDVVPYRHPAAYASRTPTAGHKYTAEQRHLYVSFQHALRKRQGVSKLFEEPWYAACGVLDDAGASVAAMFTLSELRFVSSERDRNNVWVMFPLKAGTTGEPVTAFIKLWTVMPLSSAIAQILEQRVGVKVSDIYNAT